jgi:asparagine synthase (glutamine-hydrolysing)
MILSSLDLAPGQVPCYTFAGLYGDSFDVKIAKAVADALQQPHYVLRLDRRFLEDFPTLLEKVVQVSDGHMDVSGVPNLYVNALARDISPIRLTGNYGQEVLRRYAAFRPMPPFKDLFDPRFADYLRATGETYREAKKCHPLTFALFKQAPWYQFPRLSVEYSQLTLRSPLMDNAIVELVYQAPPEALTSDRISRRLIIDGNPGMGAILTDRGVDIRGDRIFSHVVRAYREFLFKMEYYFNHGMPQVLAKMDLVITPLQVEKLFLGQHKYYHLRTWLRNQWGGHVKAVLLDPRTLDRAFINKKTLADIVHGHLNGTGNYTPQLSALLTVELLHRLFIQRNWETE